MTTPDIDSWSSSNRNNRVWEIVLTGGPCAGKTTAMTVLTQKLSSYGYKVLRCPETATLVITGGVDVVTLAESPRTELALQRQIVRTQRNLRERFRELAALYEEPVVLLFDRGEMDNAAYMNPEVFHAILEEEKLSLADVRDSYDLVLHLVTAADGAEHAYTTANNAARSETPELARELDRKTLAAWVGHPHLRVLDNSTDFDTKMNRALRAVTHVLGQPAPLEIERKFLVAKAPDLTLLAQRYALQAVEIEQTYLLTDNLSRETRVRRRTQGRHATYYHTEKTDMSPTTRVERERIIAPTEYHQLLESRDPTRATLKKTRYCFAAYGLYFELDHVVAPRELWILEVELTEENEEVRLPDEIAIAREVTGDPLYRNLELARL